MTTRDYAELWRLELARNRTLIERGSVQQAELDRIRDERDMLARRAAEMARELINLKYPRAA
jgi:hypothetical protein